MIYNETNSLKLMNKEKSSLSNECDVEIEVKIEDKPISDEYSTVDDDKNSNVLEYSFEVGV